MHFSELIHEFLFNTNPTLTEKETGINHIRKKLKLHTPSELGLLQILHYLCAEHFQSPYFPCLNDIYKYIVYYVVDKDFIYKSTLIFL